MNLRELESDVVVLRYSPTHTFATDDTATKKKNPLKDQFKRLVLKHLPTLYDSLRCQQEKNVSVCKSGAHTDIQWQAC